MSAPDYFVIKLYQMLKEDEIGWDPEGGIIIEDRQRLEASLSVYFRHNRFTSFQRQLNNFGFHKKRGRKAYGHPFLFGKGPEAVLRLRRDRPSVLETLADVAASALDAQRPPRRARPFPCVLHDMIQQSPDSVLAWADDGTAFVVADADVLSSTILPKFFRHSRLASFQRQLSLYQFRRTRPSKHGLAYHHPLFMKDCGDEQLRAITRATPKSPSSQPRLYHHVVPPRHVSSDDDDDSYDGRRTQRYARANDHIHGHFYATHLTAPHDYYFEPQPKRPRYPDVAWATAGPPHP